MVFNTKNEYEKEKAINYFNKLIEENAVIDLTKKMVNRTLSQNSYLHLILGHFASQYGSSLDEVKIDFFKRGCNRELFEERTVNKLGREIVRLRSSRDLNTKEMTNAIERFRNWSSSVAGIYLPSPNEKEHLIYLEQEVARYKHYV